MQSSPRIEELRQKFHENPRRYFAPLANEYRKAGDPEQAIAICRAHLAQQPGHMSGHVVYGQALYDAGRIDEASTVFRQALALDPENMIVLRHLGDIARQRGEVDEARSWYSRALDGDPQDTEVAAYLAELTEPTSVGSSEQPRVEEPAGAEPRSTEKGDESDPATKAPDGQPEAEEIATLATFNEESPYLEEALEAVELPPAPEPAEPAEPEPQSVVEAPAADEEPAAPEQPPQEPIDRGYKSTPAYESSPIITRTLAELYLEQGYIEPALEIYRELAEREPHDEGLRARVTELSADLEQGAAPSGDEAPAKLNLMEEAAGAGETVVAGFESERPPDLQTDDLWDTADSWGDGLFEDTADTAGEFEMSRASEETPRRDPTPTDEFFGLPSDTDEFFGLPSDEQSGSLHSLTSSTSSHQESEPPGAVTPAAEVPAEETEEVAELESIPAPEYEPEPEPMFEAEPEPMFEAEPEPVMEAPTAEEAPRGTTIREFFATLGSMRPPAVNGEDAFTALESSDQQEEAAEAPPESQQEEGDYPYADDAFASLFENSPVSPEDSRAAAALSSAVAHNPPSPIQTPSEQRPSSRQQDMTADQTMQESEDDIRRFREWLDGLANS